MYGFSGHCGDSVVDRSDVYVCSRKFNNLYLLICTLSVQFVLLTSVVYS